MFVLIRAHHASVPFALQNSAKMNSFGATDEDSEYSSSRYVPPLKNILLQLAQNQLSIEEYPSVMPLPENAVRTSGTAHSARRRSEANSLRGSTTSRWQRSSKPDSKSGDSFSGERQLVFVVGGLCFSELRLAREVQSKEGKEVILGSTHFTNPNNFMQDVSKLG
jgi:syntaxin-binding protein 1